jgi:hypothetical protein
MQTKDEEIFNLIDSIGQHYRTNIGNRYVRNAFSVMPLDTRDWGLIESITEKAEYYRYQGYHMDELYERILALARFVYHARRELQPQLRARLSTYSSGPGPLGNDKILRDMAVNNFDSNLSILADLVNKLYARAAEVDTQMAKGGVPVFKTMRGLDELGTFLVPQ